MVAYGLFYYYYMLADVLRSAISSVPRREFHMTNINLSDHKDGRIHIIGVGGCSTSGLAQILTNMGYRVTGSDMNQSQFTDVLKEKGIPFHIGHDASYVDGATLVAYTAAIKPTNVEFARAKELGLPMLERSELLGLISKDYPTCICISGCHGKTTITSMMALVTKDTPIDPTVHVGGMVEFLSGGVRTGKQDVFITEACEYVRSFMTMHPSHIILNNIDDDHLDYYKDLDEIKQTFVDFTELMPEDGILFANADDANTCDILPKVNHKIITYSLSGNGDYTVANIVYDELGCGAFDVCKNGETLGHIKLNVPGKYNIENALACTALCHEVFGMEVANIAASLEKYHLAGRRFELMGERDGVKIFHDYAHHPTEIKACLAAAKNYPHKKLYVLFQCNSFTRAKTLKEKYAFAFEDADVVMMPDIYPGRDIDRGEIHATDVIKLINEHSNNCLYLPTFADIKAYLLENWQPGDMVITLGSGDVYKQQMILLQD